MSVLFKRRRVYNPPAPLAPPPTGSQIPDPSLQLWLRSENIPTGSKFVTSWPDASGQNHTVKRLVKTNIRITHDTTTIGNGQRSLSFSGRGESRLAVGSAFRLAQYGTFVLVYKVATSGGTGLTCAWWDRNDPTNRSFAWDDNLSQGGFAQALPAPVRATHPASGRATRVVMLSANQAGWTARSAARSSQDLSLLTGFTVPPGGRLVLGGRFSDNQNLAASESFSGSLAEVLFYSANFPETRQIAIMQELCAKFGVPFT